MKNIDEIVDEALKAEPSFMLRKDFKDRIVQAIRKKERTSQRKLYLWMTLGTVVILAFGYATISYFLPSIFETFGGSSSGVDKIIPMATFIGIVMILIEYLDKNLRQRKYLQQH